MTNKQTSEKFYTSDANNEDIDLGKIFRFMLMQSKLIISIVFVVFVISFALYSFATKRYMIQSLLQYEAFDQNVFNPSQALQIGSNSSSSDISNVVALYESRTNYLQVINDLKLNIIIRDLKENESIDIDINSDSNDLLEIHNLNFSFYRDSYSLLDDNLNEIQKSEYGQQIDFNGLRINAKSSSLEDDRPIKIQFRNPESMYSSLKNRMNVTAKRSRNSFLKNEGLITVSYISDNTEQGKEIINYANNIFLGQRINDENEKSRKAINFIDQNIRSIEKSVETNKEKLKEFQKK